MLVLLEVVVLLVLKVLVELKVLQVGHKDLKVFKEQLVQMVHKVRKDSKVTKE